MSDAKPMTGEKVRKVTLLDGSVVYETEAQFRRRDPQKITHLSSEIIAAAMTASEREALIPSLNAACANSRSAWHECKGCTYCHAAAELSRLAAENERLREGFERASEICQRLHGEGAAITDAAVERAVAYCALYMTTHKTKRGADDEAITAYLRDMLRGAFEAARSESHQASAEAVVITGNAFYPPLETCNACGQNYVAAMGHGCGGT